MSLLDNLRKFLYGAPGMTSIDTGDEPATGQRTQGFIGQGGEMGGGLLQQNFNQMNNADGGLLENIPQGALLGAALYSQGMKGKDPLEGAFPAYLQAAKARKFLQPKKTELQKNLEAAGFKSGTPEYAAALQSYLFKGKENTLGKEALALYNESKTVDNFENWYGKLPKNKKQLWNKYIKGNESAWAQFLTPPDMKDIETPDLPKLEITNDMIQAVIDANGGNISRNDAIKAIEEDYKKNPDKYM
jgi:hypothetical protein|tara:strand:- start:1157 stop:1891 length:735 start_codon:yes stop_codon:yes gene_type:complete